MIFKYIKNFVLINGFLLIVSLIQYYFLVTFELLNPFYNFGIIFICFILRNILVLFILKYLHQDKKYHAFLSYMFGYILDCVDGRMARKYSMGSDIGMALDCVSDNVSNAALFGYILLNRQYNKRTIASLGALAALSYMLSLSFGLNEAIASYETTGNDNFYEFWIKTLGKYSGYSTHDDEKFNIDTYINEQKKVINKYN